MLVYTKKITTPTIRSSIKTKTNNLQKQFFKSVINDSFFLKLVFTLIFLFPFFSNWRFCYKLDLENIGSEVIPFVFLFKKILLFLIRPDTNNSWHTWQDILNVNEAIANNLCLPKICQKTLFFQRQRKKSSYSFPVYYSMSACQTVYEQPWLHCVC